MRFKDQLYQPQKLKEKRWKWFALRDKKARFAFHCDLRERLWGQQVHYENLVRAIKESAEACLPLACRRKPDSLPWEADQEVRTARKRVIALKCRESSLTPGLSDQLRQLELEYATKVGDFLLKEVNFAVKENDQNGIKVAWQAIRKLTGKKRTSALQVPGDSPEDRLATARSYFHNLLSAPTVMPTATINIPQDMPRGQANQFNIGLVTVPEVRRAAWQLCAGKAPGPDGIPVECFRVEQVILHMASEFNRILVSTEAAPSSWGTATIVPVPKKPGARSLELHRGISLMNIAPKLFNRLLLNRLQPVLDPLIRNEQNGFRRGRTTIQHVLTLRRIMEEAEAHRLEIHLVFIDYKKAFDSVTRNALPTILAAYGVPDCLQYAVCSLYENTQASVKLADGLSPPFTTETGVLQGDVLAPFLFVLYMDLAIRNALPNDDDGFQLERRRSTRHPEKRLSILAYADDVVLMSSTRAGVQRMLDRMEEACRPLGLVINVEKTKAMALNSSDNTAIQVSAGPIERCTGFVYLGCHIPQTAVDIRRRRAMAWTAMGKLQQIWASPATPYAKSRLFEIMVEPILAYGGETWTLSPTAEAALDGTHARLLRSAMGFAWPAEITTVEMFRLAKRPRLSVVLRKRRQKLIGAVSRGELQHVGPLCSTTFWCPGMASGRAAHRKFSFLEQLERDALKDKVSVDAWLAG
jgi:hypothetical protein